MTNRGPNALRTLEAAKVLYTQFKLQTFGGEWQQWDELSNSAKRFWLELAGDTIEAYLKNNAKELSARLPKKIL